VSVNPVTSCHAVLIVAMISSLSLLTFILLILPNHIVGKRQSQVFISGMSDSRA
jgi:hypothetical protein